LLAEMEPIVALAQSLASVEPLYPNSGRERGR
jgi:hypothetical protein